MKPEIGQDKNDEVEKCILCGKDTEYVFKIPIQERNYYIPGCGQLCKQCYLEIKDPEAD